MKKRHKNLQPWLDYFRMLQTYEEKGFLQMEPEKHEAYVTLPALYTLADYDDNPADLADTSSVAVVRRMTAIGGVVRHLRDCAAFRSRDGYGYMSRPFAVHVVTAGEPHDLLHTIVVTTRRRWYRLWTLHDEFDVISYDK